MNMNKNGHAKFMTLPYLLDAHKMHKPNSSMMTRADINHDLIPSKDILMSVANPSYSPIKKLKIDVRQQYMQ
jgi:hypothetical protein|nr:MULTISPECIES: hypothetical protein [Bacteroidales]